MELKLKINVMDLLPESVMLGTAAMMSQREKGVEKYGKTIEDANLSASELVEHAQQEMADGLVYTSMLAKKVKELEDLVAALRKDGRADLVYWVSTDGMAYWGPWTLAESKERAALRKIYAMTELAPIGTNGADIHHVAKEALK